MGDLGIENNPSMTLFEGEGSAWPGRASESKALEQFVLPDSLRSLVSFQFGDLIDLHTSASVSSAREELSDFAANQELGAVKAVHAYSQLMLARQKLKDLVEPGRCGFQTLTSEGRVALFSSPEFTSWVRAEHEVERPVLWLTDLDKTKAAGDAFTFVWEYRIRKGLFTEQQNAELVRELDKLDCLSSIQKGIIKTNTPLQNAQLILDLWRKSEFEDQPGISLDIFWHNLYWPSNIGFSKDERAQFLADFAPEYVQRVFPGAREEMAALAKAGVVPVIVTHGDCEIAQAVAACLGIEPENVTGAQNYYSDRDIHIGVGDCLVITDRAWNDKPQSGKLVRFNAWVRERIGEVEYVVAGFDGDSPASDGGAMLTLRPRLGYFMVDTPGAHDAGRLPSFIEFVRNHSGGFGGHFYAVSYDEPQGGPRP
jgi:hypothetical protein